MQAIDKLLIALVFTGPHLTLPEFLYATANAVQRGAALELEQSFKRIEISPQHLEMLKVTVPAMQMGVERIFPRLRFGKCFLEIATLFAVLRLACAKRCANPYREALFESVLSSKGAILDRPVAIVLNMVCEHVGEQLDFLEVAITKLAQVGQANVQTVGGNKRIILWYQPSVPKTSPELAINFTWYQPGFPNPQCDINRWLEKTAS